MVPGTWFCPRGIRGAMAKHPIPFRPVNPKAPRTGMTEAPSRSSGGAGLARKGGGPGLAGDPRETMSERARERIGARISRRAADRLRAGHLWVYASDIESLQADEERPPALLPVADARGVLLGTALFSP